jgi:hypothetical protein
MRPSDPTAIELVNRTQGYVYTVESAAVTAVAPIIEITPPPQLWWRPLTVSCLLDTTANILTARVFVQAIKGTTLLWQTFTEVAIPIGAAGNRVVFGVQLQNLSVSGGILQQAPLPDTWCPPNSLIRLTAEAAGGVQTLSEISWVFQGTTDG